MKKPLVVGLVVMSVLCFAVAAWGVGETYNGYPVVNVVVNGQPVKSDVPAIVMNGRTLLPVKAVADALNLDTKYDSQTNTVFVTSQKTVVVPPERPAKKIASQPLDCYVVTDVYQADPEHRHPFYILDGEVYGGLAAFGRCAEWDGTKATVTIPGRAPVIVYRGTEYKPNIEGCQYGGRTVVRLSALGLKARFEGDTAYIEAID